jgi:hypothetical protein
LLVLLGENGDVDGAPDHGSGAAAAISGNTLGRARRSGLINDMSGALQDADSSHAPDPSPQTHVFAKSVPLAISVLQLHLSAFVRHGYQSYQSVPDCITRDTGLTQALAGQRSFPGYEIRITKGELTSLLADFGTVGNELFPAEQARILRLVVARLVVGPDGLEISLRVEGITSLVEDLRLSGSTERQAA